MKFSFDEHFYFTKGQEQVDLWEELLNNFLINFRRIREWNTNITNIWFLCALTLKPRASLLWQQPPPPSFFHIMAQVITRPIWPVWFLWYKFAIIRGCCAHLIGRLYVLRGRPGGRRAAGKEKETIAKLRGKRGRFAICFCLTCEKVERKIFIDVWLPMNGHVEFRILIGICWCCFEWYRAKGFSVFILEWKMFEQGSLVLCAVE